MEAVNQCIKRNRITALHENANGNKANIAPMCRKIKKPIISLFKVSLGFTLFRVGIFNFSIS
jgi:hypothetical protein